MFSIMENKKLKNWKKVQKMVDALVEKKEVKERVMNGEKLEDVAKEKNIRIVQPVQYS
tara:strand:- start:11179 stop:11352 length:174 start_codon:yes stop_codon:yes gene_type:complete